MYIKQLSKEIIFTDTCKGAIINAEYDGFIEDYLTLHCLLKRHSPSKFLEIGTNEGRGTEIICNALYHVNPMVYTLDLPEILSDRSLQHPSRNEKRIGHLCTLPFIQLLADSMEYNYSEIGELDGCFIDGEHDYKHAYHETLQMIKKCKCKLIIWHDANLADVWAALNAALQDCGVQYELFRVMDTRIAYALKK